MFSEPHTSSTAGYISIDRDSRVCGCHLLNRFMRMECRLSRMLIDASEETVDSREDLNSISRTFSAHSLALFKFLTNSESMHVSLACR